MKKLLLIPLIMVSFSFAEEVFVIDIEGMTCEMCPIAVKKAISRINGVKWVLTSLNNNIAVVIAEDGTKEDILLKAISRAGNYKGTVIGKTRF